MSRPGPDELHIEDDEGRAEFNGRLDEVVMAAQGLGVGSVCDALDDVWQFVFGEMYPYRDQWETQHGGTRISMPREPAPRPRRKPAAAAPPLTEPRP